MSVLKYFPWEENGDYQISYKIRIFAQKNKPQNSFKVRKRKFYAISIWHRDIKLKKKLKNKVSLKKIYSKSHNSKQESQDPLFQVRVLAELIFYYEHHLGFHFISMTLCVIKTIRLINSRLRKGLENLCYVKDLYQEEFSYAHPILMPLQG